MSEFKYACPVCGQHIKCDFSQGGLVMECPTCFQKITVPQAPATDDPKFIMKGTQVGGRSIPSAPVNLGAATPPAKGPWAARIVFVLLLCAVAVAVVVFRGTIFKSSPGEANVVNNADFANASSNRGLAQPTATVFGYRVDPDEVVFVFEPAAYGVQIAADAQVHVAGDFNRWLGASEGKIHNPSPAWQMRRLNDDRYELHKKLADFHYRPQWEFKFVVNLSQWIDAPSMALNRSTGEHVNLTLVIPEKPGEPSN